MQNLDMTTLAYILLPIALVVIYSLLTSRKHKRNKKQIENAVKDGLAEPASLHPVFDETKCLGCKACISACPEKSVIGVVHNKARLVNPSHCIGHGACKKACPFDAISLVFGSEKRGVDIPMVKENFETNIPGIFIAGELGGMGLIRNAVEQGKQAIDNIDKSVKKKIYDYDVVIVGAGPAGIAATLGAKKAGLKYLTLEQDSLGGAVFSFPRGKIVMTAPVNLPIVGKIKIKETSKEALLTLWQKIEKETGIDIKYQIKVDNVIRDNTGFKVITDKGEFTTSSVLLCIGRRGTPRKLGVPGEEQPKVVYRLIDPEQYKGMNVLVVGGGDSALEAALSIAEQEGSKVTLSYRSEAFSRAKQKNRERIDDAMKKGQIDVIFKSNVATIDKDTVTLNLDNKEQKTIKNNACIVSAGGILPTGFLKEMGVEVETKYGTA